MAKISSRGEIVETSGELPAVGDIAPSFALRRADLSPITLADYQGSRLVLNIFPSIDTPTCAKSVRQFNQEATALPNTKVLCVSADLPFALSRFCGAEGIDNVETASVYRSPEFGTDYGVYMDIQEAINLGISQRFAEEDIGFPYPTRTLYLNTPAPPGTGVKEPPAS